MINLRNAQNIDKLIPGITGLAQIRGRDLLTIEEKVKIESKYLKENAKDILYGKAQWFMAEDKVKRSGIIRTTTSNYDWVTDKLSPEKGWKK